MQRAFTTQNLPVRLVRLLAGLFLYGIAISLMIRGNIGASPWDVFAQGSARTTGLSFGLCTIIISGIVLLFWIPLKQKPGLGTIANAVLIGVFADWGLAIIPQAGQLVLQCMLFAAGLFTLAFATALYIGAGMGPGPRDGLMTGLVRVTGRPVWMIRTSLELTVVVVGFFMGGVVGAGTAAFALGVGPLTQLTLKWLQVDLHGRRPQAHLVDIAIHQPAGPDTAALCAGEGTNPLP
ncbi:MULTISPECIES: YitT family protein [unclassified Arthrobacter]|uniref:membrane protein YczE n=1 Tax=unclassified Arthrobacter TaxID=235627 RepID=UPI001C400CB1|nr:MULTISPECIES: hypothetical protein [unclassified Arthrobacter]MCQ9165807.1 hypothetical protein [Arthrobacter sp. STN4]